jgi:serine/threonine protein kinase
LGIFIDSEHNKYIATEFMPQGNLLSLIQRDDSINELDMLNMARQAAAGMSYLASQGIIHRYYKYNVTNSLKGSCSS